MALAKKLPRLQNKEAIILKIILYEEDRQLRYGKRNIK